VISYSTYAVAIIVIIFICLYRFEKIRHNKKVSSIPLRIWVNGTRGKSSVTRLIAAGLRAGGKRVFAKTTGTSPRMIMDNGSEQLVNRLGMANISEQIRIIKTAKDHTPDAIVLECMALRPDLQRTESLHIVNPNIVVITNVRPDHLDVMGPTVRDIARAFINAVPPRCSIITSEPKLFDEYTRMVRKKDIKISIIDDPHISNEELDKFSYIEHKDNIALALEVCQRCGIKEGTALQGMQSANPDPGALKKHLLDFKEKSVTIINAMAANDPESTLRIWSATNKTYKEINLLINCRDDRIDRSFQIADLIRKHMEADRIILTGKGTVVLKNQLQKYIQNKKIDDLGNKTPVQAVETILKTVAENSLIFALGNTVGYGMIMIDEFLKYRSK
jgi:poly-gamma-glutamate synthase PgsB/CapB